VYWDRSTIDANIPEYWSWLAVALFLLTTVDMITTVYAAYQVGVLLESNPIVRWSLLSGPIAFMSINLSAVVLVTVLFDQLMQLLERLSHPYNRYLAAGIEAWLGGLIAGGLVIFANNLTVIFFQQSLL
jgi:hypothetical protein